MKQKKRRYLLSPCRDWDIPGLESWLEDMSMMGWTFKWTRLGGLLFEFWETVPHPVKFRMEPVQKIHGRFADAPEPDQQRFYEGFGWKFICRHGAFFLYRNEDPAAPELNTDPQVQALTMDYLKKSVRRGLVTTMLITFPLLLLFISHFFLFSDYLSGTIYTFLFCSFYFFSIMDYWILFFQTEKLRKKLKNGIPMTHRKNWHPGSFIHRAGKVTMLLSCFVLVFAAINARFALNHTPLEQWTEPIPFVTYTELAPEIFRNAFRELLSEMDVVDRRVATGYQPKNELLYEDKDVLCFTREILLRIYENEFSDEFGSVEEVLDILEKSGMLETDSSKGTFLKSIYFPKFKSPDGSGKADIKYKKHKMYAVRKEFIYETGE